MVKVAAPQEGVGKIFFGVGGDDDHGPVAGADGLVDLDDVELHLIEDIQHVVLEIGIRLVDFVDQQHRPILGHEGLADLAHLDIGLDVADVAL